MKSTQTAPHAEWWKGAVIYQIYPRSFRDSNGDGVGDLRGILDGLPYIASLGVDGVWISPFFTSPQADFGYDVSDYCDVDPVFGTLEDFDDLVRHAHALGLKVIVDQVYSHTSEAHPWFGESRSSRDNPKADWYVWADPKPDGAPPNNWQSVFGGPAWTWDARRRQYYMHQFLKEQPQLNVQNHVVRESLLQVARFWLDRGVDGFRLDAINHAMHDPLLRDNPPSGVSMDVVTRPFDMQIRRYNQSQPEIIRFLEQIRELTDDYKDRFTVAEIGGENAIGEMKSFTHGEGRLNSAYSFDFLYANNLTPEIVCNSLEQWSGAKGEGWPSWAFSNHDAPRCVSRWAAAEDRERAARAFMMLLMALRGNPFLYQGEELALPQADIAFERLRDPEAIANWPKTLGRDGARTPMPWMDVSPKLAAGVEPWLPIDPRHEALAVSIQEDQPDSMLSFTRRLIATRKAHPVLLTGALTFLPQESSIVAFERSADQVPRILCAVNISREAADLQLGAAQWTSVFSTHGVSTIGESKLRMRGYEAFWAVES